MTEILLKLYFDTTTWIRVYEDSTNDQNISERNSIDGILEMRDEGKIELISSKFQLNQLYTLKSQSDLAKFK